MTTITFDPHNPADLDLIGRLFGMTAPAQPVAPTQPVAAETDCHGMAWNEAIHSSPASFNSDGSWRARRGKKREYEAALADLDMIGHMSGPTAPPAALDILAASRPAAPAPTTPQPAAPAPTTPPAPIEYEAMVRRFMQAKADKTITDHEAVYNDLSITRDDLETNQTNITRLWDYMNSIDAGQDHDEAVRYALGSE